ncbi:hypothetical protein FACS1894176_00210 [Bacteroidia bacterium]|nr:hypothetical protein FACS1894176_00210 [Bacteroidia bacterium]
MTKKTTTQSQVLSPEKYIHQKSRNLPVYKCWITQGWKEDGIAQVVVARQHTNGNVTVCMYLTDLKCLGVKDTLYKFNILPEELHEILNNYPEVEFEEISYELAHNIIYAAIEFAEEYGFKPHKDFTQTTRFLLEEDTDDIPFIDVPCGRDGKPFYVNARLESPAREKQILAQLEKTAFNELSQLSKEQQKALFLELAQKDDADVTSEGVGKLMVLTHLLATDYAEEEAANKYREELLQDLDYPTTETEELPNSLFAGVQEKYFDTVCDLYFDTSEAINEDEKKGKKAMQALRDEIGEAPIVAYAELEYLKACDEKKYVQKLEEYHTKYPDYFLIKFAWHLHLLRTESTVFQKNINTKNFKSLLSEEKQPVTDFESDLFALHYFEVFIQIEDNNPEDTLARIFAFEEYISLKELDLGDEFTSILFVVKLSMLSQVFRKSIGN